MSLKDTLRDFTPPVVWRMLGRLQAGLRSRPVGGACPEWEYLPEGWSYAQSHLELGGWNAAGVLATYKEKWPRFLALAAGTYPLGVAHESDLVNANDIHAHNTIMVFAYALALAVQQKNTLSLLDWGGGIGHYLVLARALLPGVSIDYHCKDVPLLADYGKTLFPDQKFSTDESCLGQRYDFVLASASLHYTEKWQPLLKRLVFASKDYLLITRLPTTAAQSYVFIQRPYAYGYDTEYLGWCLNRDEFMREANNAGASLVREFVIGESPEITNAPGPCQYRGYLFRGQG